VASSARHSNCPDPTRREFSPSRLDRATSNRIGPSSRARTLPPSGSTSTSTNIHSFTTHSKPCSLDHPGPGNDQGTQPPIIAPVYRPNSTSNSDSRFHHSHRADRSTPHLSKGRPRQLFPGIYLSWPFKYLPHTYKVTLHLQGSHQASTRVDSGPDSGWQIGSRGDYATSTLAYCFLLNRILVASRQRSIRYYPRRHIHHGSAHASSSSVLR
jgi:hypothetical protein